jgi:hypothetical protein
MKRGNEHDIGESGLEAKLARQVRDAPEPLRSYIRELERQSDSALQVRALVYLKVERDALARMVRELRDSC